MKKIGLIINGTWGSNYSIHKVFMDEKSTMDYLKKVGNHMKSPEEYIEEGFCVFLDVEEKDYNKIVKQGFMFVSFEFLDYKKLYCVPILIKSSKSGLVKEHRKRFDPEATEYQLFQNWANAKIIALDKDNVPNGYSLSPYTALTLSKD